MRPVLVIAMNTFREIIRDRILYGIVVFALLLISLSIALGDLTFAEQARISANFGFMGIHLSACILAIFAGSTLVAKEIEKQTILTLLARPISRSQFLVGKFTGLVLVIFAIMCGLAVVLAGIVWMLGLNIGEQFAIALFGVFLESLLLTSITLFFGVFTRPIMTVIFTASLFLIGHWIGSLDMLIEKSKSEMFKIVGGALRLVLPNLERFNWRSAPVYELSIPATEVLGATAYAAGWILVIMACTSLIFRRRDFV